MAAVAERSHADILPDKPLTHDPLSVTMPSHLLALQLLRIPDRRAHYARPPRDADRLSDGLLRHRRVDRSRYRRRVWRRALRSRPACRHCQQNQDRRCARPHRRVPFIGGAIVASAPAKRIFLARGVGGRRIMPSADRVAHIPCPCSLATLRRQPGPARAGHATGPGLWSTSIITKPSPKNAFGSVHPRSEPRGPALARPRYGAPAAAAASLREPPPTCRRRLFDCGSDAVAPRSVAPHATS